MQRTNLTRVFLYSGVRFPDPDPAMNPIAVRDLFAAAGRPELSNAEVRGPEIVGNELHYTLHRAVGTKGGKKHQPVDDKLARFDAALKAIHARRIVCLNEKTRSLLGKLKASGANPLALPSQAMPWLL